MGDPRLPCTLAVSPPQENAHFSISESLIAAIELMKCNLRRRPRAGEEEEEEEEGDSDCEIQQLKQKIRLRRQQIRSKRDMRSQRGGLAAASFPTRCYHTGVEHSCRFMEILSRQNTSGIYFLSQIVCATLKNRLTN